MNTEFTLLVLLPVALGALCITGTNVARRYALKGGRVTTLQFLIAEFGLGTLLFGVIYLFLWGPTAPKVLPGFWRAVLCGSLVNVAIQFLNAKAASLDKGEVSLTAPLQAMTPGLITGLAILLGEYPSRIGVCGIALMACGSYILLYEGKATHWSDYLGPVKRLKLLIRFKHLSHSERAKTAVVCMALGSATLGTVGLLFDGLYARRGVNLQGITLGSMTLSAILALWFIVWRRIKPDRENTNVELGKIGMKPLLAMGLAAAIFWVAHVLLIQPAYEKSFVAYVGTLKRFSILFSVVLGFLLFKEAEFKKRLWAAIFILAGAILISSEGLPGKVSAKLEMLGW